MISLEYLTKKIENRISEYLEFDVTDIFKQGDYISIYGGAVRDSLADMDIHDIDIMCMPKSAKNLSIFIQSKGYDKIDLVDPISHNMYKDITIISEPWTYMNKNRKVIQIIRPKFQVKLKTEYVSYIDILNNVDISSCGVFIESNFEKLKRDKSYIDNNKDSINYKNIKLDVEDKDYLLYHNKPILILKESCKNGIISCLTKTYSVNKNAKLYNADRSRIREFKLESRGWKNIDSLNNKNSIKILRTIKLFNLNFKPEYDYKTWYENDYIQNKYNLYDDFY